MDDINDKFRSGYVAVAGKPNVGKSTLVNALIGAKVAIVSDKPGTTRSRIQGVMHADNAQIVFVDTPGITPPRGRLGVYMQGEARTALDGVDTILVLVQAGYISNTDLEIISRFRNYQLKKVLAVNKVDSVSRERLALALNKIDTTGYDECIPISAANGTNLDKLKDCLINMMPQGPMYFPDDMFTDQPIRNMCAEIIREKALELLRDEVPHGIGVEMQSIRKINPGLTEIFAAIYVEKQGHKGIVIGRHGMMLQNIGTAARLSIEELMGTRVALKLWVKVREDWRNHKDDLATLGYTNK